MAAKKTIANLATYITADAVQFAGEFKKADAVVSRFSAHFQKEIGHGLKFGVGLLGAQTAMKLIEEEVRHVIDDIDKIPGIPATTVQSIQDMKSGFHDLRHTADVALAGVIGFAEEAAQSIGALFAVIHGADVKDITDGLSKQNTPDQNARIKDDNFDEKITAAAAKLRTARDEMKNAGETRVQQFDRLMAESERYYTYAGSASLNSVEKIEAETNAVKRQADAHKILAQIMVESKAVWDQEFQVMDDISRVGKTTTASLEQLAAKRRKIMAEKNQLALQGFGSGDDPAKRAEKQLALTKELLQVDKDRLPLLRKNAEMAKEFGDAVGQSFEDAIFSGESLSTVFHNLLQDIMKLVFRQLVSVPISNAISMGILGMMPKFAGGGDPPVGEPYIVGENGPEVRIDSSPGTIIPNHAIRRSGGGGGGNTYVIDARGTDESVVTRLAAALKQLAGPGVVERRSLAAVGDYMRRGGAFA